MKEQKKVLLLMSGGVDSSVSALILKKQGYKVTGVTMKLQNNDSNLKDINDAKNVAKKLGIDHFIVDLHEEFKERVVDPFVKDYLNGVTPNPCVKCNKWIKFGRMLKVADEMGFDYIATGHYAKIEYDENQKKYILKRNDFKKDQSYVLYNLKQEQLSRILFPISNFEKEEIRKIAKENGLGVFDKPDSQDICFIKNGNHVDFIENYTHRKAPRGDFLDEFGNKIGEHDGIIKYTIGQRKGLGVSFGKPMFVIEIDKERNAVILGEEESQYKDELIAEKVNFTLLDFPTEEMKINAKTRYKSKPAEAILIPLEKGKVKIKFLNKQKSITPGQSVVFYQGDVVIGGGIIVKS